MKIKAEHLDKLVEILDQAQHKSTRTMKEHAEIYLEQGLTQKRFLWDWLWSAPAEDRRDWFRAVYEYADDRHIDTAIRAAADRLGVEYKALPAVSLTGLAAELAAWQTENGLPQQCAQEQLSGNLSDDHAKWLKAFAVKWDAAGGEGTGRPVPAAKEPSTDFGL